MHTQADDKPIETAAADRLGFAPSAQHIAEFLKSRDAGNGLVFGLDGRWGSGKTSYINLISAKLKANAPLTEIVHFAPWLVSSRDALIEALFQQLATAVDRIEKNQSNSCKHRSFWQRTPSKSDRLRKKLIGFSRSLTFIGSSVELAGLFLPGATAAGGTLRNLSRRISKLTDQPPLEKQKEAIAEELEEIKEKIFVFIDDVDRLEPSEIVEVVRLVRAVADFPNIVYILCYSSEIVEKSLSSELKLRQEHRYLDKIVQTTFSVPMPGDFDLRCMFKEGLFQIFPTYLALQDDTTHIDRLLRTIDIEGGQTLATPRDVVRALNAIALYGSYSESHLDLGDLVWLQLVRLFKPDLYVWTESYLRNFSSVWSGASISEEYRKK